MSGADQTGKQLDMKRSGFEIKIEGGIPEGEMERGQMSRQLATDIVYGAFQAFPPELAQFFFTAMHGAMMQITYSIAGSEFAVEMLHGATGTMRRTIERDIAEGNVPAEPEPAPHIHDEPATPQ